MRVGSSYFNGSEMSLRVSSSFDHHSLRHRTLTVPKKTQSCVLCEVWLYLTLTPSAFFFTSCCCMNRFSPRSVVLFPKGQFSFFRKPNVVFPRGGIWLFSSSSQKLLLAFLSVTRPFLIRTRFSSSFWQQKHRFSPCLKCLGLYSFMTSFVPPFGHFLTLLIKEVYPRICCQFVFALPHRSYGSVSFEERIFPTRLTALSA